MEFFIEVFIFIQPSINRVKCAKEEGIIYFVEFSPPSGNQRLLTGAGTERLNLFKYVAILLDKDWVLKWIEVVPQLLKSNKLRTELAVILDR